MITAKVETITPEIAKKLLSKNDHNRKVTKSNVEAVEKALKNGEWQISGQTIIISASGVLMDGQHRLQAVMNSGISMQHLVCRGVNDDVFKVIDTGKNRSGADVLSIAKVKNSKGVTNHGKIANLIKLLDAYKNRHLTRGSKFSNTEILAIYEDRADFLQDTLAEGEQLAREASPRFFNDYQLAVMNDSFKEFDMGEDYLLEVLKADILKPSEHLTLVHQVKSVLARLNKEDSNRVTQEQKYYIIYEGYKHYVNGTMFDTKTSIKTHDVVELRKVSKTIPYL